MDLFNIGDRVILHGFSGATELFNGMRGEIFGEGFATIVNDESGMPHYVEAHRVSIPEKGVIVSVDDNHIKRDRGDMDTPVSWKDCAWMPEELRA